jgi:hypothetical protein
MMVVTEWVFALLHLRTVQKMKENGLARITEVRQLTGPWIS